MPRKLRQLRADHRRAGARVTHQAGSHEEWRHPFVPDLSVELAGRDGHDAKPYQERHVRTLLRRAAEEDAKRRHQP